MIEAERIERDFSGWSWWSVVLVINDPRWCCVRRVNSEDLAAEPGLANRVTQSR